MACTVKSISDIRNTSCADHPDIICNGFEYYYDATDTTSQDNGGTVLVSYDGGVRKLQHDGEVSAAAFGVIPNIANIGPQLNAALKDHVGKYKLRLPQGQLLTGATIIDIPSGADVVGTGPVNSNYGSVIGSSIHGTQIVSQVQNDFAVRIAYNAPYVAGGTNVGNFEVVNTVGKGLYCQSMGTGANIFNIAAHDCAQEGAQFSYFQDSTISNLEIVNCGGSGYYGVKFDTNCNACRIDKLLIVQCRQPYWMDNCTFIDFYNPHIEQGEYPTAPNNSVNCSYIPGGFKFTNSQHINFYGGLFVPNSSEYLAAQYSTTDSQTPFYLNTDSSCKNIKMFGPKFSSPQHGARFVSANNIEIIGGTFNGCVSTATCIEGTNLKLLGGQAELYDNQTQTNMLFSYTAGDSVVSDFEIVCSNPNSSIKNSGALFDGSLEIRNYKVTVDKSYYHMGNNVKYAGARGNSGVGYTITSGVIDVHGQNAGDSVIINSFTGPLLSLNGTHGVGNIYCVTNNTNSQLTIGVGGNIALSTPVTIPAYRTFQLKHIPGTGALSLIN